MSWLSRKFGVPSTPTDSFLLKEGSDGKQSLSYEHLLFDALPTRFENALKVADAHLTLPLNSSQEKAQSHQQNKTEVTNLQAELAILQKRLQEMRGQSYVSDLELARDGSRFFSSMVQWLSRHERDKDTKAMELLDEIDTHALFRDIGELQALQSTMRQMNKDYLLLVDRMPVEKPSWLEKKQGAVNALSREESARRTEPALKEALAQQRMKNGPKSGPGNDEGGFGIG